MGNNDSMSVIDTALTSVIGRVVALLGPLFLAVVGAGTLWLQNVIGLDLQEYNGAAAAWIGTTILGGALMAYKWLSNRGEFERVALELKAMQELGAGAQDSPPAKK